MSTKSKSNFKQFLKFFPKVSLPVSITEDTIKTCTANNKLLPKSLIEEHIIPTEDGEIDEFTEYEPCFRIVQDNDYNLLMYWKASLMSHEYILCTYDKKGELISKRSIAGTKSNGETVVQSVAVINEDLMIHVMIGQNDKDEELYDPNESSAMNFEILGTGDIIFSLQS